MIQLTPKRLNEIEVQLMNIQYELQHIIPVHESIKNSSNMAQRNIVESIAEARNALQYLMKSIQTTL